MIKPCHNNGTCHYYNTANLSYVCLCSRGFNGNQCQFDNQLCQQNTCWNNGTCNEISNTTFHCSCEPGWEGIYCETKINYCQNVSCENNGVCQSLVMNYTCDCLDKSYTGGHCQIIATRIVNLNIICKSVASVAIVIMICTAMFVIIMDVLKYLCNIDLTRKELEHIRRKKQAKKRRKPMIIRYIYVNARPKSVQIPSIIIETAV